MVEGGGARDGTRWPIMAAMQGTGRFVFTVLLAALLLAILYLALSALVDGYLGGDIYPDGAAPDSWDAPDSWAEWQAIVVIAAAAFLSMAAIAACVLLAALTGLALTARRLLRRNVAGAIDSTRELVDEIRGTAEFMGESAVSPVIRVYSIASGVRRGMGAMGAAGKRFRGRR